MSTFYLLPPRPLLGERFAGFVKTLLPGLDWNNTLWPDLAEVLDSAAARQADVYVVYREELPAGENVGRALVDGFGAETGDRVIEVRSGPKPGELMTQSWCLGDTATPSAGNGYHSGTEDPHTNPKR